MKKWNAPAVEEMNINETAHNWTGIYRDGGYIGDGEISGHLSWTPVTPDTPGTPNTPVTPTPDTPVDDPAGDRS